MNTGKMESVNYEITTSVASRVYYFCYTVKIEYDVNRIILDTLYSIWDEVLK